MEKGRQVFILYCPVCDQVTWFDEEDFLKYKLDCGCKFGKEILLGAFVE